MDAALGQRGGPRRRCHGGRPGVRACLDPPARRLAPGLRRRLVRRRPSEPDGHGCRLPSPARPSRHRSRPGTADAVGPGAGGDALGCRRRLQVGNGLPGLHLHRGAAARWGVLPPLGQSRVGPLRRAAVHGGHGLVGERAARRVGSRPGGRGGAGPLRRRAPGQLAADRGERHHPGGTALLLRLGHRGGVHAPHRADREGQGAGGQARGGPEGRRRPPADCAGGLRGRQPRVLPAVLPAREAQHLPPSARRHRHGGGRGEPAGHRLVGARTGRGAPHGGDPARGPLLELLARQPVVGDHRLRRAPEQPQRPPGRGRRRRDPAGRHRPRGSGRGELARHGRAQCRSGDFALRPHGVGARAHDRGWSRSPRSRPRCRRRRRGVTPDERKATIAARRLAVSKRFAR